MAKELTAEEFFGQKPKGELTAEEFFAAPQVEQQPEPLTGFQARMAEDYAKRKKQVEEAQAREATNEYAISKPLQVVGANAGLVGDTIANLLGSGARYTGDALKGIAGAVLPDELSIALAKSAGYGGDVTKDVAGEVLNDSLLAKGIQKYQQFAEENPELAANLGATGNIAANIPLVKPVAGAVGVVGKGAGKVAGKTAIPVLEKLAQPALKTATSDEVKALASGLYKQAAEKGGILKPEFTNKLLDSIEGATPKTEIGLLLGKNDPVTKLANDLAPKRGRAINLKEAQEFDELLGDLIDDYTEMGVVNKKGKKLLNIQNQLRQSIDDLTESEVVGGKEGFDALKQARAEWSKAARLRDIEKIIDRAELTDNPATSIRSGFRTLASNPNRMRGYTPEQQKLIRNAAKTGMVGDIARVLGSRLNPIIAGSTGGLGAGAAAQAAAMAGRGLATQGQLNRAAKVAKSIAGKSTTQAEPSILNRAAQSVLDKLKSGDKAAQKELMKLTPREINIIKQEMRNLKTTKK